MNAIRRIALAAATAALTGSLASPTLAADTANADATVVMAAPCVSVASPQLDFGIQGFSTWSQDTTATAPISFSNCSEVGEFISVHGTDAVDAGGGGTTWTLFDVPAPCPDRGLNVYGVTLDSTGGFGSFSLSNFSVGLGGFPSGVTSLLDEVTLIPPCVGSDGSGASMSFQIVFIASF